LTKSSNIALEKNGKTTPQPHPPQRRRKKNHPHSLQFVEHKKQISLLTLFIQHMGYNISLVRGGLQVKTIGPWPKGLIHHVNPIWTKEQTT
jgi:hypothetical protein